MKPVSSSALVTTSMSCSARSATSKSLSLPIWSSRASLLNAKGRLSHERCDMTVRCGIGYDLHRLAEGRKLIVGGIELPFEKGPVGHSDGDVLAHALCDALLGAAGLGDIGTHFPDSDPKWKGANSLLFLEHAKKLLAHKNFAIEHVDAVVITEKPKLGPHFPKMRG